jgi:hypothetical protein
MLFGKTGALKKEGADLALKLEKPDSVWPNQSL